MGSIYRDRFPTAAIVQALAGTCPYTKRSGKKRLVLFRKACDRDFRRIAQQWAIESVKQSIWAATYWQDVYLGGQETWPITQVPSFRLPISWR